MKHLPLIILVLFVSMVAKPQSAFNLKFDAPVLLGSVALAGVSTHFQFRKEALAPGYYPCNNIWKPERWACGLRSKGAGTASHIMMAGSYTLPLLLMIHPKANPVKNPRYIIMGMETMALTVAVTAFTKSITRRKRPYVYGEGGAGGDGSLNSFFSGHTSTAAAATFFFASSYTYLHLTPRWKPWVWTAAVTFPAATGALRIAAGKHFLTDVLVGYVVGAGIGSLVPFLQRKTFRHVIDPRSHITPRF